MRRFVIGDSHGRADAVRDVLRKARFNYSRDQLIILGDVVDGGRQTRQLIDILLKTKNRIFVYGNHDCLTPDAEALTDRGWKKYNELTYDDLVFSFDTSRGVGMWMPINDIIIKDHNGGVVVVDAKRARMCMTPTHRVLCKRRYKKPHVWGDYEYVYAWDLSSRVLIQSSSIQDNPDADISDDKIKLAAWILTDGWITERGYIGISQSKYVDHIRSILDNLGYEYSFRERIREIHEICGKPLKTTKQNFEFYLRADSSREIREFLPEKNVPAWAELLSQRQFDLFITEIVRGDGSFYTTGGRSAMILYGKYEFLSAIQSVCATHGYTATLAVDNRGCPRLNLNKLQTIQFDCNLRVTTDEYRGVVWCITTPLSNFMVRQGGTHFFTGNCWAREWYNYGYEDPRDGFHDWNIPVWIHQGGSATIESYEGEWENIPKSHIEFMNSGVYYYIDDQNNLFVHGGLNPHKPIEQQKPYDLMWDRDIIEFARENVIPNYNLVFIGHTTVAHAMCRIPGTKIEFTHDDFVPLRFNNLIMRDTGGGWDGQISLMNVDTLEYWQSHKGVDRPHDWDWC
jgi:hypothetical protein